MPTDPSVAGALFVSRHSMASVTLKATKPSCSSPIPPFPLKTFFPRPSKHPSNHFPSGSTRYRGKSPLTPIRWREILWHCTAQWRTLRRSVVARNRSIGSQNRSRGVGQSGIGSGEARVVICRAETAGIQSRFAQGKIVRVGRAGRVGRTDRALYL